MKPIVIIESPYAGEVEENLKYARLCVLHSLLKGEVPFASHLLYPQVLDDNIPEQRELGIKAGLRIAETAQISAVYTDRGISPGMQWGIKDAQEKGRIIEYRSIYENQANQISQAPVECQGDRP